MLNTLSRQSRRVLAGLALLFILVFGVKAVQKTQWAVLAASHPGKQMGNPKSAVTLMEYSDFQCPSCKAAAPYAKQLFKSYPEDILFVFKHFPLERHPYARIAAEAAECAKEEKKFWEFHDLLFDRQAKWSELADGASVYATLTGYGRELGLNENNFENCRQSPLTRNAVAADVAEGDTRQVDSTPTFFLNSFRLVGAGQLYRDGARLAELEIKNANGKITKKP